MGSGEWWVGVRLMFQIVNDARGEGSVGREENQWIFPQSGDSSIKLFFYR